MVLITHPLSSLVPRPLPDFIWPDCTLDVELERVEASGRDSVVTPMYRGGAKVTLCSMAMCA